MMVGDFPGGLHHLPDPPPNPWSDVEIENFIRKCIDYCRLQKAETIKDALDDEAVPSELMNLVRTALLRAYEKGEI